MKYLDYITDPAEIYEEWKHQVHYVVDGGSRAQPREYSGRLHGESAVCGQRRAGFRGATVSLKKRLKPASGLFQSRCQRWAKAWIRRLRLCVSHHIPYLKHQHWVLLSNHPNEDLC